MFKSRRRRPAAPPPETAKVAEAVKAYYDAGHRAPHWEPPAPATGEAAAPDDSAEHAPEPETAFEPEAEPEPEPDAPPVVVAQAREPSSVHKTLAELAVELEAFIEIIRYGDNLGSSTVRA